MTASSGATATSISWPGTRSANATGRGDGIVRRDLPAVVVGHRADPGVVDVRLRSRAPRSRCRAMRASAARAASASSNATRLAPCAPTTGRAVRTGGVRRAGRRRTASCSATATASGTRSRGERTPCTDEVDRDQPDGCGRERGEHARRRGAPNTSWNRDPFDDREHCRCRNHVEDREAQRGDDAAAPTASVSCTSSWPSATNATPATVAAASRLVTLNATLMNACRCTTMSTASPTAAAMREADRARRRRSRRQVPLRRA